MSRSMCSVLTYSACVGEKTIVNERCSRVRIQPTIFSINKCKIMYVYLIYLQNCINSKAGFYINF